MPPRSAKERLAQLFERHPDRDFTSWEAGHALSKANGVDYARSTIARALRELYDDGYLERSPSGVDILYRRKQMRSGR